MKKVLITVCSVVIVALLAIVLVNFNKNNTPKDIVDGEFGFLRNSFDLKNEKIEDTGATWYRPNFGSFTWGAMQKDEYSAIDFLKTDEIINDAQKRGLNLDITLFPYADWDQQANGEKCKVSASDEMLPRSKGDFETPGLPYYRCNPVNWIAYQKWLRAVVERYDGDGIDDMEGLIAPVSHYEIVNEPDLMKDPKNDAGMQFYIGTPETYVELLKKSYTAIKSADDKTSVLVAGAAGVQPEFVKFWESVFSNTDIASYFDIANVHCLSAPNQDKNDPTSDSASDLNVKFYKNILSTYNISKPIWVTEAENIQGDNVSENAKRLEESVKNALANGAEKIFFTGSSLANDPMRYTSEILISEKNYYKNIISTVK